MNGSTGSNGSPSASVGFLVKYDDLVNLLSCVHCNKFCHPGPAIHCRSDAAISMGRRIEIDLSYTKTHKVVYS